MSIYKWQVSETADVNGPHTKVAYHKLEPHDGSFFVDVTLVDGNHGSVIVYSYKIDVDPLKVQELIRVPRF